MLEAERGHGCCLPGVEQLLCRKGHGAFESARAQLDGAGDVPGDDVHRRADFRAAPASVARMRELVAAGTLVFHEALVQRVLGDGTTLGGVELKHADGSLLEVHCDQILAFYGLHPKLGPIAEWGLELERKALKVDTEKFQTSEPGIFAVGDINTYPGKKKLILSGFHEAALAAFGVQGWLYPEKKQFLQYTTTSPVMQKRLGVS